MCRSFVVCRGLLQEPAWRSSSGTSAAGLQHFFPASIWSLNWLQNKPDFSFLSVFFFFAFIPGGAAATGGKVNQRQKDRRGIQRRLYFSSSFSPSFEKQKTERSFRSSVHPRFDVTNDESLRRSGAQTGSRFFFSFLFLSSRRNVEELGDALIKSSLCILIYYLKIKMWYSVTNWNEPSHDHTVPVAAVAVTVAVFVV